MRIRGELVPFSDALERAEERGACDDMELLRSMEGWEEFCKHKNAPFWCRWYAVHVLRGPWPEAEEVLGGVAVEYTGIPGLRFPKPLGSLIVRGGGSHE